MKINFFASSTVLLGALTAAGPTLAQEVLLLKRDPVKPAARVSPKRKQPPSLTITRSAAPLSATAREVQSKIKAGDLIGAIDLWSKDLAARPDQVEGWIARAALKRQIGDLQGAQEDLDHVLEAHPTSVAALIARSSVRRRLNDLRGAGQDIDRAANLAPNNQQVFSERSSLRFALSDMTGAMADYSYVRSLHHGAGKSGPPVTARPYDPIKGTGSSASLALVPTSVAPNITTTTVAAPKNIGDKNANWHQSSAELAHLNNVAVQEINGKHFDLAIKSFERLLKISPEYAHARDNLVIAHNNYGLELAARHPQDAMKEFRAALYLDPTQPAARKNLAALIAQTGKDSANSDHRQKMAEECLAAGDKKGAYIELTEALRLKNSQRLRSQLLAVLAAISESESALEVANLEPNQSAEKDMPPATILGALNPAINDKVEILQATATPALLVPRNAAEVIFDVDANSATQNKQSQQVSQPVSQTIQTVTTVTQTTSTQTTPIAVSPISVSQVAANYESPSAQPSTLPIFKTTIEDSPETILQVARQLASEDRELDAEALLLRLAEILRKKKAKGVRIAETEMMLENALDTLSELYVRHSRLQKAERTLKELVEIREKSKGQDDPILGKTLADYSSVLRSVGRPEEARKQELKADYIFNAVH